MKYNVLSYLIKEGFRSVFKNKKATIASLGTMCATMFIFGIFFALGENINFFVKGLEEEQAMRVNIDATATDEEVKILEEQIKRIPGVNKENIEYVTQQEALEQLKKGFGEKAYLVDMFGAEIYPRGYIVRLTDLQFNLQVQDEIRQLDNVTNITNSNPTVSYQWCDNQLRHSQCTESHCPIHF